MNAYRFRYRAYAAAHGLSPAAMLRHDRKRHLCASGLGFILWMGERWAEWGREHKRVRPYLPADHTSFDAWLRSWCFVRRIGRELLVGDSVEVSTSYGVQFGKVEGFVAGDVGENFTRPSVRTDSGRLFVGCHPEYVRRIGMERVA
jgi:hypothetical protein